MESPRRFRIIIKLKLLIYKSERDNHTHPMGGRKGGNKPGDDVNQQITHFNKARYTVKRAARKRGERGN